MPSHNTRLEVAGTPLLEAEEGFGAKPDFDSAEFWNRKITVGKEARKRHSKIDRWDDFEGYWLNKWPKGDPVFNLVYMFGRALIPSLIFQYPTISNVPRNPSSIPFAALMDSLDAWLVQEMEVEDMMKTAVLNAFLYNMGAVETGFDFPEGQDTQQLQVMSEMGMLEGEGQADRARRSNFPWFDIIPPRQLVCDPLARNVRQMQWYAKLIWLPTRILEADDTLIKDNVNSTHKPKELMNPHIDDIFQQEAGVEPYTAFWEIHDAVNKRWHWQTVDQKFLFEPVDDPLQVDGLPIDLLVFNQNPLNIWGCPDSAYIEPQMLLGNEARRNLRKHLQLSLTKFLVNGEALQDSQIEDIFTQDIAALRVQASTTGSLDNIIREVNHVIPFDIHNYNRETFSDSQQILGFGTNQLGQFFSGRRTRGEVEVVEAHNQLRIEERRYLVARTIQDIFRKVNQYILTFWRQPMVMRVIGVDAMQYWVQVNPADIKAELETRVVLESLLPPSRERTKREMIEIAGLLANVSPQGVLPLIRQLLTKFPWADINAMLPQAVQQQPMQQQEFVQQQQQQMGQADLGRTARQNLGALIGQAA